MTARSQFRDAAINNELFVIPIIKKEGFTQVRKNGKYVYMTRRQLGSNLERETLIQFQAQSVPATAIQQGSPSLPCDILITKGQQYKVDDIVLSFTVSVANQQVTLAPSPLCIDHIEIASKGGSSTIQLMYGENIFFNLMALNEEQMDGISKVIGMTPDFLTSLNVIPYVPLIGNCLAQSKLYLGGLEEDFRIRIYFINAVEKEKRSNVTLTNFSLC